MPYIVTTLTPTDVFGPLSLGNRAKSRRAVATLGEAKEAARRVVEDADYPEGNEAQAAMAGDAARCDALAESGGAVVLPEGTVIEVERVTDAELEDATPLVYLLANGGARTDKQLCSAFNAAQ